MKKQNKQKGITLVALVVTIVILLILAGISLNLILGENGIVTKANEGRTNYTNASEEEHALLNRLSDDLDAYANGRGSAEGGGGGEDAPEVLNTATTNQNGIKIALSISGTNVTEVPLPGETFEPVDDTTIPNGYVVRDKTNGNEFVWIPVAKDQVISLNVETEEDIDSITLYNPYGDQILTVAGSSLDNKTKYDTEIETYGNANCVNGLYKAVVTTTNSNEQSVNLTVRSLYAKDTFNDYFATEEGINAFIALTNSGNKAGLISMLYNDMHLISSNTPTDEEIGWAYATGGGVKSYTDPTETDTEKSVTVTMYGKSVNDNGGFYIARYEAGTDSESTTPERTSLGNSNATYTSIVSESGTPVSKSEQYVYSNVTRDQAKCLAESMYSGKSSLLTKAGWDRVLGFITEAGTGSKTISQVVGNSSTWGNYQDSLSPANVTGFGSLQQTGFSTYWQAKNIFDLAGNAEEWILGMLDSHVFPCGGSCYYEGARNPAGGGGDASLYGDPISFRPALYL